MRSRGTRRWGRSPRSNSEGRRTRTAALTARDRAEERRAVEIAHQRIRGEDVTVPDDLAALVRAHEPGVRADVRRGFFDPAIDED
jgi:hypothetical protein